MRKVGEVVICRAGTKPGGITSISASKETDQEYEFTIVGVRGAGKTSSYDYLLLVPDNAPEGVGWEFNDDDVDPYEANGHYSLPSSIVGLRGVGCHDHHIIRNGVFGNATSIAVPIELTPKEKELCAAIDILEQELKIKDVTIAELRLELMGYKYKPFHAGRLPDD